MKHLTDEQDEILNLLSEECAEIIKEVSKVRRFGFESRNPEGKVHRDALQQEIGDVLAIVYSITRKYPEICRDEDLEKAIKFKIPRLKKYVKALADLEVK